MITHRREVQFNARGADLAPDAPIPCVIATTAPVRHMGMVEVLDCSPAGVDLSRAPLPLIVGHDASQLAVGVIEGLEAHGDKVTGFARFGTSDEAQQIRADVLADIHRGLSAGYSHLDEGTPVEGGAMKFRWQPFEVSITPIPADPASGFFRSIFGAPNIMQNEAAEVAALCQRHGLPELTRRLSGMNLERARAAILDELAARDHAAGGHLNVRSLESGTAAGEREAIINTLIARMGGRPAGPVIGRADCVSLAVRALQASGHRVTDHESRDAIIRRSLHTTSDFPALLGDAVGRVLMQAYAESPSAIKAVSRLSNLPDFRTKTAVRLGNEATLELVNEHGEFKHGTVSDRANGWKLATYGRIIGLTRQALVNDDLGGFAELVTKFGQAAAAREADELAQILITPPNVDGAALFSEARSSLMTGGTAALGLTGLSLAVRLLRLQREVGGRLVAHEPGALVVPAALEMPARQLVATLAPTTPAEAQPYQLDVVVEPRLDAASPTTWYLAARNQMSLEHGYLDGAQGVQVDQRDGFEIDGLELRARLDFGCGWVSSVGWVRAAPNP